MYISSLFFVHILYCIGLDSRIFKVLRAMFDDNLQVRQPADRLLHTLQHFYFGAFDVNFNEINLWITVALNKVIEADTGNRHGFEGVSLADETVAGPARGIQV